jgi:hypothetical protein
LFSEKPVTDWEERGGFYLGIQPYHESGHPMPGAEVSLTAPLATVELLAKVSSLLSRHFTV